MQIERNFDTCLDMTMLIYNLFYLFIYFSLGIFIVYFVKQFWVYLFKPSSRILHFKGTSETLHGTTTGYFHKRIVGFNKTVYHTAYF
jgi:hypothetical protein